MEIKQVDDRWLAKKSKKAKTLEDITDIIKFDGDFCSVMGKAGRTSFHSYLGKSGGRWLEMYGVTSLLNFWGEKERLLQWAVDRAVDHVEKSLEECVSLISGELNSVEFSDVLKEARSAHKRSLEEAGDHGTDRHSLVELYINARIAGVELDYVDESLNEFVEWSKNVTFLNSELPLRSKKLWLAGTTDYVCEIDGKRYIGDLKTSTYVSFKHFLQCGAYALMYEEMGMGKIDGIIISHMPRAGGFTTHIDTDVDKYKKGFESLVSLVKMDKDKSYQLYN